MSFLTTANKLLTTAGYTVSAGLFLESYYDCITAMLTDNLYLSLRGIGCITATTLTLGTTTQFQLLQPRLEQLELLNQLERTLLVSPERQHTPPNKGSLDSGEII